MAGNATGAAVAGLGHGSDVNAHGGISPSNGPGGAGGASAGSPAVKGVDISGDPYQVAARATDSMTMAATAAP